MEGSDRTAPNGFAPWTSFQDEEHRGESLSAALPQGPPSPKAAFGLSMSGRPTSNPDIIVNGASVVESIPRGSSDPLGVNFAIQPSSAFKAVALASDRTQLMRNALSRQTSSKGPSREGSTHGFYMEGLEGLADPTSTEAASGTCAPSQSFQLHGGPRSPRLSSGTQSFLGSDAGSANLRTWGCTCAVVNLILGNAVFTLAYGFRLGGWLSAPIAVLTIIIFLYTATLLGDSLEMAAIKGYRQPDYGVVGELAFGSAFRPFFTFFCAGECFSMCVFFLVFIADSIHAHIKIRKGLLILVTAASGVIISLVPKRYIAVVSAVGLGLTLTCATSVVACGYTLDEWAADQSFSGTAGLPGAMYTMSFVGIAVADHPVFPGLYHQVQSPRDFFRGLCLGHAAFGLVAITLCCAAYTIYGTTLRPVALTNIGYDVSTPPNPIAQMAWIGATANILIAFRTLLVLPSFIRPVVGCIQDFLVTGPHGRPTRRILRISLISLSFGSCAVAASCLQNYLPQIEALTSSMFKSMNALIIPCWSYSRLYRVQLSQRPFQRVLLFLLILGGVAWGLYGTCYAVLEISGSRGSHGH